MMKLFFTALILLPFYGNAQNVGIGTVNPAEKLDLNGNMNITGSLKITGNAGTNGQVLMSTGGGLTWGSTAGYKRSVMYTLGSGNWIVPAGVTEVMTELWGGGGGGSSVCGGTGGGYARTVQTVVPGNLIPYSVGAGGTGSAFGTATAGGTTTITFPSGNIQAYGGGTPGTAQYGLVTSGGGSLSEGYYMWGNPGTNSIFSYLQKNAGTFIQYWQFGNGGAPVGMLNTNTTPGDLFISDTPGGTFRQGDNSKLASAGGAAGYNGGWNGASGMVVFWYN